jgi:hypothetical protein
LVPCSLVQAMVTEKNKQAGKSIDHTIAGTWQ